jgi:two-component system, NtrC family, sensor kinase
VTLYLPRTTAETVAEPPVGGGVPATGRRMLLVEDNPEVAEVTRELLTGMGCDTESVRNAEEALKALADGRFDLVLSDIVMAGPMNGLDLARAIRAQYPDVRVVLATATRRRRRHENSRCCASLMRSSIWIGHLARASCVREA